MIKWILKTSFQDMSWAIPINAEYVAEKLKVQLFGGQELINEDRQCWGIQFVCELMLTITRYANMPPRWCNLSGFVIVLFFYYQKMQFAY